MLCQYDVLAAMSELQTSEAVGFDGIPAEALDHRNRYQLLNVA